MLLKYLSENILQEVLNLYLLYQYDGLQLEKIIDKNFKFNYEPHLTEKRSATERETIINAYLDDELIISTALHNGVKVSQILYSYHGTNQKETIWSDEGELQCIITSKNSILYGKQIYYVKGVKKEIWIESEV
jgi:hypothetical protein